MIFKEKGFHICFFENEKEELWVHERDGENTTLFKKCINCLENKIDIIADFDSIRVDIIQKYFNSAIQENEYWIGTDEGLKIISGTSGETIFSYLDETDIFSIYLKGDTLHPESDIWLGTVKQGLLKLNNSQAEPIDTFYNKKGFFEKVIYSIVGDKYDNLWFSTNHGLYKFDIKTEIFNCYRIKDGLPSDEFNSGTMKSKGDSLYFGGINGIACFVPYQGSTRQVTKDSIAIKYSTPGKKDSILFLSYGKENILELESDFRHIKITPLVFNFQNPRNNQYRYKLNSEEEFKFGEKGKPIEFAFDEIQGFFGDNKTLELELWNSYSNKVKPVSIKIKTRWRPETEYYLIIVGLIVGAFLVYYVRRKRRQIKTQQLITVHEKINEISRLKSIDDICTTALKHFIKIFKVDYAIISLIDFNEKKLKIRYAKLIKEKSIRELETTTHVLAIDNLEVSNIFYKCLKTQEIQSLERFTSKQQHDFHFRFFKACFQPSNDIILDAFIIPMIHRSVHIEDKGIFDSDHLKNQNVNEGDTPLGVIEIGFIREQNSISKLNKLESQKINLKLYIDNCAQPFYRVLINDKEKELLDKVIDQNRKEESPITFLKYTLESLVQTINADYGIIALNTFNHKIINFIENKDLTYGYALSNSDYTRINELISKENHKGICRHVMETGKPFYSNNVHKLKEGYIEVTEDIHSELALPLIIDNIGEINKKIDFEDRIGVLILSSKKPNFFNKIQVETLSRFADRITDIYLKKKLHYALSDLSEGYDIFSKDVKPIYGQITTALSKYFDSDYISIWERTTDFAEKKIKFKLVHTSSNQFQEEYEKDLKLNEISVERRSRYLEKEAFNVKIVKELNEKSRIYELCQNNSFQSYLILRVTIENDYEIFINIFSKRELNKTLRNEDKIFIRQITRKAAMAIQSAKLVSTFKTISESLLNKERTDNLQTIMDNAVQILHADLVSLYYFKDDRTLEPKEPVFSQSYPKSLKRKNSKFADTILRIGTRWISTEEKYITILNQYDKVPNDKFTNSKFWKAASLKSVAAIRLMFKDRPLGVMFFNFKPKKDFDRPGAKRFIKGFAEWATLAILNADYLDDIKDNIRFLHEETVSLEKQKDELRNKYEEVQTKMEEIIPQATRTSFYLIIEGMNHDIRNSLIKLKQATINIKNQGDRLRERERININARIKDIDYNIKLISNLLNLYDFKKIKKEVIDVNKNIKDVIFNFKHRNNNIDFDTSNLKDDIPDLLCYKVELSMVFYNIINNAISAIEEKEKRSGRIKFYTELKNDNYIIKIEDDGIGISNEKIEKIFEAGYSTKEEGVGIGLYFVKEILQNNFYGIIECNSTKGKGTTFTINIPKFINQID